MNIKTFINELQKLNISPTKEQLEQLETYAKMLLEYNKKFNLTAITKQEDIYLKHFYDSLTITKEIDLDQELKVLDIGTGAGFPGIVLKIFFPKLDLILLDSNNKKISFLNEVIKELGLKKIKCIHGRAEELPTNYREYFDIVTSRAVANLRVLTELSIPYLKVNGYFISLKGKADVELKEAESTLKVLNCEIEKIEKFILPDQVSERAIIKIRKEKETPDIYPRKYDKIKKQFLK
jgi:16S rRNA (guanine527-N7)-methyltransferase